MLKILLFLFSGFSFAGIQCKSKLTVEITNIEIQTKEELKAKIRVLKNNPFDKSLGKCSLPRFSEETLMWKPNPFKPVITSVSLEMTLEQTTKMTEKGPVASSIWKFLQD